MIAKSLRGGSCRALLTYFRSRWSAAKGVGRITDRLSAEFSDEIVENILTLFSARESSCAWNGGCLALAELGKEYE